MRITNIEPDVYFGEPGLLVKLPWPKGGLSASADRQVYDFPTGSGGHRMSSLLGTSRLYTLNWNALGEETYHRIAPYWLGHMGPGPFAFIDPSRPNLLTGNQSSAGTMWRDTRGFKLNGTLGTGGGLSVNRSAAFIQRFGADRSIKWAMATSGASGTINLILDTPWSGWRGFPIVGGSTYTFSFRATPDGVVDSAIDVGCHLSWYRADGSFISTSTKAVTTLTGWSTVFVTAAAPPNAAFCEPSIDVASATAAAGSAVYVDLLQLEMASVINSWAPGTGVQPVAITGLGEAVPFDTAFRLAPSLTLRELV